MRKHWLKDNSANFRLTNFLLRNYFVPYYNYKLIFNY